MAGLQIRGIPAIPDFKFGYWKSQCPRLMFLNKIQSKIIQEGKQSDFKRSNLTEQERHTQKSGKAKQSVKKQSVDCVVKNFKWLEKILSMGNARERKDVLQMWDTRFSGWILDFKLLVSCWIVLKNSNLKPCYFVVK